MSFALAAVLALAAAASPAAVAPDTWLLPGQLGLADMPDGNTIIWRGPEGLVVLDAGRGGEHTGRLIEALRSMDAVPRVLLNSHWHLDHLGGNLRLRDSFPGLEVRAAPGLARARETFLARYAEFLEQQLAVESMPPAQARQFAAELGLIANADRLAPDGVIARDGTLRLAGRPMEVHVETHAVSDGDLWLYDPATRLLAAGDLVVLPAPLFDTACAERWQAALERIAATGFEILVPGHGRPMDRAEFATWRRAFDGLLACASGEGSDASCVDGWFEDAGTLSHYPDADYARRLVAYYVQSRLRAPAEERQRYCPD